MNPKHGEIFINGYQVTKNAIYFTKMDSKIEVKPQSGYIFSGWKDKSIQIPGNNRITFEKT